MVAVESWERVERVAVRDLFEEGELGKWLFY